MGVTFRNNTQPRVSFFTFKAPPYDRIDAFEEIRLGPGTTQIRSSVESFSYTKALGEAAGQVQIVMTGYKRGSYLRGPWVDFIAEGDWWMIDVIKNGRFHGIAFGRIDRISITGAADSKGAPITKVTIGGRDIGFALEDTPVYINPWDPAADNAAGRHMMAIIGTPSGKPHQIVKSIIEGFMGVSSPVGGFNPIGGHTRIPSALAAPEAVLAAAAASVGGSLATVASSAASGYAGAMWASFIDMRTSSEGGYVQDNLKGKAVVATAFGTANDSRLWDFVNAWRNPAFNELYLDMLPRPGLPKRAALVLREKPFVNTVDGLASPWYHLRSWQIEASSILRYQLDTGRNRVNHFQLLGDMVAELGNDSMALFPPYLDLDSVKTHGLHRLQENTRYYSSVADVGVGSAYLTEGWLNCIVSWNVLNHRYLAGRLDLGEMRPEIRPGEKVFVVNGPLGGYGGFPADRELRVVGSDDLANLGSLSFYVEAVQHNYVAGPTPSATTSIQVSRGYIEGDRLRDLREAFAQYDSALAVFGGSANNPAQLAPTDSTSAAEVGSNLTETTTIGED